jgi:hypothetical protein
MVRQPQPAPQPHCRRANGVEKERGTVYGKAPRPLWLRPPQVLPVRSSRRRGLVFRALGPSASFRKLVLCKMDVRVTGWRRISTQCTKRMRQKAFSVAESV